MTDEEREIIIKGTKLHQLLYLEEFMFADKIHCVTHVSKMRNLVIMPKKSMEWTEMMGYIGDTNGLSLKEFLKVINNKGNEKILKLLADAFPELVK